MSKTMPITVSNVDATRKVTGSNFETVLLFSHEENVEPQLVDTLEGVTIDTSKQLYKMLTGVLGNTVKQVYIAGVDVDVDPLNVIEIGDALTSKASSILGKFFYLATTVLTLEESEKVSTWATANDKMYMCTAHSSNGTENVKASVDRMNSDNTLLVASADAIVSETIYDAGASLGAVLSDKSIGSWTANFKRVNGMPATLLPLTVRAEYLGTGKINVLHEQYDTTYVTEGVCTSGAFIDNIVNMKWVKDAVEREVFNLMINKDKIPYTTDGLALVKGVLSKIGEASIKKGIAAEYSVIMPSIDEILSTDKTGRVLNDIKFKIQIQGAIHQVNIFNLFTVERV